MQGGLHPNLIRVSTLILDMLFPFKHFYYCFSNVNFNENRCIFKDSKLKKTKNHNNKKKHTKELYLQAFRLVVSLIIHTEIQKLQY